ncbi:DUF3397 domain-containing protein [Oceanobacillus halotolerans]|uniref:DUF3397 domain-containing protein n=1 Tax=Oceanobacillus halotolerans TaxID=2663380 RepID=UPI0013DA76FF|nr:DUF3397 domain-containing protein [Oceanobacillus halotolerans]
MLTLFTYLLASMIVVPYIMTVVIYLVAKAITKRKWKGIHIAVNWTTVFYILAVLVAFQVIFAQQLVGIILIILLSLLSFIIIIQWKKQSEVVFKKAFRFFWRLCFLLFNVLYIILILVGIVQKAV